jgi:hypothetical protein
VTARKPERDRETLAIERTVDALRKLDVSRYSSQRGGYQGGRKAVRRVVAYLETRFPA